jgi:hypothetical protein
MSIILPWWLSFLPIAIGTVLLLKAWGMNSTSSFHDGSFAFQMTLTLTGGGFLAVGLLWLAVALVFWK